MINKRVDRWQSQNDPCAQQIVVRFQLEGLQLLRRCKVRLLAVICNAALLFYSSNRRNIPAKRSYCSKGYSFQRIIHFLLVLEMISYFYYFCAISGSHLGLFITKLAYGLWYRFWRKFRGTQTGGSSESNNDRSSESHTICVRHAIWIILTLTRIERKFSHILQMC